MIDTTTLSPPARALHDRLSTAGRLHRFDELASAVRGFLETGMAVREVIDAFDLIGDRAGVDVQPEDWRAFRVLVQDIARAAQLPLCRAG